MRLEYHESAKALRQNLKNKMAFNLWIFITIIVIQFALTYAANRVFFPYKTYASGKYISSCISQKIYPDRVFKKLKSDFREEDGSVIEVHTSRIIGNNKIIKYYNFTRNFSIFVFILTSSLWFLVGPIKRKISEKSNKKYGKQYIRGTKLISEREYQNLTRKDSDKIDKNELNFMPGITLVNNKLDKDYETKHAYILGSTGKGKSQAAYQTYQSIMRQNKRCIIHDPKGEYLKYFYRPDKDILFNPVDKRSVNWNIFNEIETMMDIETIASSLIPEAYNKDRFWNDGARAIFASILNSIYMDGEDGRHNKNIWDKILTDASILAEEFVKTIGSQAGYRFIHTDSNSSVSNPTDSLLATLMQYTKCFEYMAVLDGNINDRFSITKWIKNGRGSIFLTSNDLIRDTLKPILSLFIDLLGKKLLSEEDDDRRRIFFILDEFATLQKLSSISNLLTKGRSKGASVILAIQDFSRIDDIYGKALRHSIINSCSSKVIFAVEDAETAKTASDNIGEVEYFETLKTVSSNEKRGTTLSKQSKKGYLFIPSEIQQMKPLEAIVKLGKHPYFKSNIKYQKLQKKNDSFIYHENMNLEKRRQFLNNNLDDQPKK